MNGAVIARHSRRRGAGQQAVRWANDLSKSKQHGAEWQSSVSL
jgi:hypothetical protein